MGVRRRLGRLEGDHARPCIACGWGPDEIPPMEVVLDSDHEPGCVLCRGCGRYLIIDWPENGVWYRARGEGR
jgi:hypothetical protein